MKELENRKDIEFLIDRFYEKLVVDDIVGHFFTTVVKLDWELHIPIMYNFWDSMLFGSKTYKGNPMSVHLELAKKAPLKPEHFQRWLAQWEATIKENFTGLKAIEAIQRAEQIAGLMEFKVQEAGK
ncbi:MAG: hemoglobin [Arcticibacterium sp.]|jgi:hemoglobin